MSAMRGGGRRAGIPNTLDLTKLVLARASTRLALGHANDAFADAMLAAFRQEIAATVRSVSPLLDSLVASLGTSVDDLVPSLRPVPGWPDWPRLPVSGAQQTSVAGVAPGTASEAAWRARTTAFGPEICHSLTIQPSYDERLMIHVVDHSLEVAAWLGSIRLRSLFGAFRMAVPRADWQAPYPPHVGDRLEDLVTQPALRGRGWTVAAVDRQGSSRDYRLSVRTGSRAYSLPWRTDA